MQQEADTLVGNDITSLDTARWLLKSPFERNIVTKFDCQVMQNQLESAI
jgi:hypothetical protein